jgi:hypothetical protein
VDFGWNGIGSNNLGWHYTPARYLHIASGLSSTLSRSLRTGGRMNINVIKDVATRLIALFISSALGIITGTGVIQAFTDKVDIPMWFQALQAGGAAVALVVYDLSKALNDGKLTKEEVDKAFGVNRDKHNVS